MPAHPVLRAREDTDRRTMRPTSEHWIPKSGHSSDRLACATFLKSLFSVTLEFVNFGLACANVTTGTLNC
jgi:hypothetical protein